MKYIKEYSNNQVTNYDNFEQVKEEVNELKGILRDLIDDFWWVRVEFSPKRWSETYKCDQISVMIKKKQCEPNSLYYKESEFKIHEIEEVKRILNIYYYNNIEIRICLGDEKLNQNFIYGRWKTITREELELEFKKDISIFGIYLFIDLGTKNIDLL